MSQDSRVEALNHQPPISRDSEAQCRRHELRPAAGALRVCSWLGPAQKAGQGQGHALDPTPPFRVEVLGFVEVAVYGGLP